MIKRIIRKFIPIHYQKQLKNFKILAVKYAQYKTIKNWDCIDRKDIKIPWYTYPAIEYLNNIDFSEKIVFEYGSGNSSSYWAKKSLEVISVENNKEWYEQVKQDLKDNQSLLFSSDDNTYEETINKLSKKFDVIIIDGIRRVECSKIIENVLNDAAEHGYMVILDNSDWYKNTAKYLRQELGLIEIDFHGFGPINGYTWTTSVFLSRNFNFKPIGDTQPVFSLGAVRRSAE